MNNISHSLYQNFLEIPDHPALEIGDRTFAYKHLYREAVTISHSLQKHTDSLNQFCAIFAHKSLAAYAAVPAVHFANRAYLPLNPAFPARKNAVLMNKSGAGVIIAGEECYPALQETLPLVEQPVTVLYQTEHNLMEQIRRENPRCSFEWIGEPLPLSEVRAFAPPPTDPDTFAYLLFTSGTTGDPKGVPVRHRNVIAYLENIRKLIPIRREDRCSQTFDFTFDLSIHDLFVTWSAGATLCALTDRDLFQPQKVIRNRNLTVWFSVPSIGMLMMQRGQLLPESLPNLRVSLFCGEALPSQVAHAWSRAASNSEIHNLYGPTETTIAVSSYRLSRDRHSNASGNGNVFLGDLFPDHSFAILDENSIVVPDGDAGELCIQGPQVTSGYLNNPQETEERFIYLEGRERIGYSVWYRTGDVVRQNSLGLLEYIGRVDHQLKVMGYRVEAGEVENAIREESGCVFAVCTLFPVRNPDLNEIVAFVDGTSKFNEIEILKKLRKRLPEYMIPKKIIHADRIYFNQNGKIDRSLLIEKYLKQPLQERQ